MVANAYKTHYDRRFTRSAIIFLIQTCEIFEIKLQCDAKKQKAKDLSKKVVVYADNSKKIFSQ